jgi:hypothetical protein
VDDAVTIVAMRTSFISPGAGLQRNQTACNALSAVAGQRWFWSVGYPNSFGGDNRKVAITWHLSLAILYLCLKMETPVMNFPANRWSDRCEVQPGDF